MEEWEKHIRHTREDLKTTSWCGQQLYNHDWVFTNIDHAMHSLMAGPRLMPCPECINAVVAVITENYDKE